MPISDEYARNERIKRLRALISTGTKHLLTLHEAIPSYVRLGDGHYPWIDRALGTEVAPEESQRLKRSIDIDTGYMIAERHHQTYSKISRWVTDADNAAPENLNDGLFKRYSKLPRPASLVITVRDRTPVEDQVSGLAAAIEERLGMFGEQLRLDGDYEDVTPALRDGAGGWPHLRGNGLISPSALDGYLARMRKRRTRAEISDSIGAAKELVEATMKGMVAKHSIALPSRNPELQDLWKAVRPLIADASIEAALGSKDGAVIKLLSSQVATIYNLCELRNRVGSGHGKTAHSAGLKPAHALLAVDTAHTLTRFLTARRLLPFARDRNRD